MDRIHDARRGAGVVCAAILLAATAGRAEGGERTLPGHCIAPEDVSRGMEGYGLTVFRGAKPEKFTIQVVGRLRNAFPKQDMILIRCTDERLRESKVVSGMSGSPIYVSCPDGRDRLAGALAYSWSFQKDSIAGVTPITNMLGALLDARREDSPGAAFPTARVFQRSDAASILSSLMSAPAERTIQPIVAPRAPGELRPVATPLIVSGTRPERIREISAALAPFGLEPVQGGAGSARGPRAKGPAFEPGDAIGVQLMRGDSEWTAIGTVSYVDGDYVLAFGHPFLQGGRWHAPVTKAEVEHVLARGSMSMKLASAGEVAGRLVDDTQACIIAELGGEVDMIPCRVTVGGPGRTPVTFRYEMVQHPVMTANMARFALADSVATAFPLGDFATVTVSHRIAVAPGRELVFETVSASGSSVSPSMLAPLATVLLNPFERAAIERLEFDVHVEPGRRTARILSARASSQEVRAGERVALRVRLRPFGEPDEEIDLAVTIPSWTRPGAYSIQIAAGGSVRPDVAPPRNLDELLAAIPKIHTSTSLVAVVDRQTKGLRDEGEVMPSLPASVINVLAPAGVQGPLPTPDKLHVA
ncbi:MAG: hypothetical protein ACYS9X_32015, partial [Planctomycetota bacterium]